MNTIPMNEHIKTRPRTNSYIAPIDMENIKRVTRPIKVLVPKSVQK